MCFQTIANHEFQPLSSYLISSILYLLQFRLDLFSIKWISIVFRVENDIPFQNWNYLSNQNHTEFVVVDLANQ